MNQSLVDNIVRAVLYEGYILYPYRPSSVKNRQRWTFGGIYPQAFSEQQGGTEPCLMQTQCLVRGVEPALQIKVRFLHLLDRKVERFGEGAFHPVDKMEVADRSYQTWQEAVERVIELDEVALADLSTQPRCTLFTFAGSSEEKPIKEPDGRLAGRVLRDQASINGVVEMSAIRQIGDIFLVTIRILNQTPLGGNFDPLSPGTPGERDRVRGKRPVEDLAIAESSTHSTHQAAPHPGPLPGVPGRGDQCDRPGVTDADAALMRSFASTHTILGVRHGQFISLTDPPETLSEMAAACNNIGCWPVLVGDPAEADTMLSSPIILEDYPQIAPESPGDLFDATEIDEILTLRILTLTDEEKKQAIAADDRAAHMFARTEALAREQLANLHGVMRHG